MKRIILVCCLLQLMIVSSALAQSNKQFLRQGNKNYNNKNFTEAEVSYRKALAQDSTYSKASYNLANTLYKQKQFKIANMYYQKLLNESQLPADMQSKVHYNMGNNYLQQGLADMKKGEEKYVETLKKSIESYKNSLRLNPADSNAKYNLAYAMKYIPKPQENQGGGGNNDKKDKNDQKDKKQQQDQNQDKNKDGKEDKQDQQQGNQQQQQQKNNSGKEQQSKETERVLQALKDNEKKTLEKQKIKIQGKKTDKDW